MLDLPGLLPEVIQLIQHIFPALEVQIPSNVQEPIPAITVVIPSYNAAATIWATLSSVMAQVFYEPYEVILVDSSTDETPNLVQRWFPHVRLIHLDQQTPPGAARNLGIEGARGEVLAFIDADCVAASNWLRRLFHWHQNGYDIVGGAVENGNPDSLIGWAGYLAEFREFLPTGQMRLVDHVPTCNISYKRRIFETYGGFPSRFCPQAGAGIEQEDLLFNRSLRQANEQILFDPALCVAHVHRSRWRAFLTHQRRIGRFTALVLQMSGGEGDFLAHSPVLALLAAPILPLVKWLRTIGVFMSQQPEVLREHALALAPFLVGLYAWAWGFVEGAWSESLCVSEREVLWQTDPQFRTRT